MNLYLTDAGWLRDDRSDDQALSQAPAEQSTGAAFLPQQRLCFCPEPQGHGAFLGTTPGTTLGTTAAGFEMTTGVIWVRFVSCAAGAGADWVCFVGGAL
jgi:hypothetical protein